MIRRPPRSTRTEYTLSLHDALPISSSNRDAAEIFAEFWDPQPSAAAERSIDTDGAWPLSTELHHFIGKDIVNFHGLFWPAMLHGAGFRTQTALHVKDRKNTRLNYSH